MEIRFENEVYDLELAGHRKHLHQAVEEFVEDEERTDELMVEIDEIHELISNQDLHGLVNGYFKYSDIIFMAVEENEMLKDALESAGYKVESSNVSRSLYAVNDDGVEVRISNHKRPAVEQNGIWMEHEYEKEIIVENNIVSLNTLKNNGFSKMDKTEYILG